MTSPRQRLVRVAGARRAQLLPAPGTTPAPEIAGDDVDAAHDHDGRGGPNDERMLREVPPHY